MRAQRKRATAWLMGKALRGEKWTAYWILGR
jgi:hypothetical protein